MLTLKVFKVGLKLILGASLVMGLVASAAGQTNYPTRAIKIIVPVAGGGTVDIVARAIADPLSKALGQPVIVENKAGVSALLGTTTVAKAAPDGYTLLAVATTFVTVPIMVKDAGYDPLKDFAPITETCRIPMVFVVNPSQISAKNLQEFIAFVGKSPKQLAYATSGNGSTSHIATELFSHAAGLSFLHVPYKGNAQAMVDVLGGQVPMMFDQINTAYNYTQTGKLHPIAVTSKTRAAIMPEVPTFDESGLKGFEDYTFNGLLAPVGTPPEVVQRLHDEVAKILADPKLQAQFKANGIELRSSPTPQAFGRFLNEQVTLYKDLAKDAGLRAE